MTSENGNFTMPVAPMGYGGNSGFGGWGNDIWLIIIILFAFGGFGGYGFGGNGAGNIGGMIYPWLNQSQQVNDGFRDQMINSSISGIQNSITSGFGDVQNSLCAGFAGVNAGIANGFAQAEIGANSRQMANMNQMFGLSQQFAQCCCDNKLATATLSADLAREACADRAAVSSALRDVLEANNASTQRILDQMCSDKIDQKNERIQELQNQLTMAQLAASQNAQTAAIIANNEAQTVALEQYLNPTPKPSYIVPSPYCCNQNYGCGCGA